MSTENVTDYGATGDGTTDDTQAIQDAANAAGTNGTVYLPAGTYRFGGGGDNECFKANGSKIPVGINWLGDGPTQTTLKLVDNFDAATNGAVKPWRYDDTSDHGEVTFEGLCLDGNYENQSFPESGTGSASWGPEIDGTGSTVSRFIDVVFEGWWTNGAVIYRSRTDSTPTFERCTFVENGVGQNQAYSSAGHGFNASAKDGGLILAKECLFENQAGHAADVTDGTDCDVTLEDCYVDGSGQSVLKRNQGASGTGTLRRVYAVLETTWIETNTDETGRHLTYTVDGGSDVGKIVIEDVEAHNISRAAIEFDSETVDIDIVGNGLVLVNTNNGGDQGGSQSGDIRLDGTATFDATKLSVDDCPTVIFDVVSGASGTIDTLNRRATNGVGSTGSITISTDLGGAAPHAVTTPAKSDVGAGSSGSGGASTGDGRLYQASLRPIGGALNPTGGSL